MIEKHKAALETMVEPELMQSSLYLYKSVRDLALLAKDMPPAHPL